MKELGKFLFFVWFVTIIFLSLNTDVYTQSSSNPFEIKPRLKNLPVSDTTRIVKTVSTGDSILYQKDSVISDNLSSDVLGPNPFEVDHVPVRKSIVDKKTEDIKTISESTKGSTRFLFFFLILGCALLAVVLGTGRKTLTLISKSLINENILKLFYREDQFKPSPFLLYLIFIINFSAFFYLTSLQYGGPSGIVSYGLIMAGIFVIYFIRHISLYLLGIVFPVSKQTGLYSFTIMVFNHFIGILLIPINLFLALGPLEYRYYILVFSIFLLVSLYLMRTFRGIFIVSEYFIDRFFQIIIYLCAFEIIPILILWKMVSNFMD